MYLDKAIAELLREKRFFAHFVMNSNIMWDAYNVPTAGACIINFTPTLIFNSEYIKKLTVSEFAGVVEHEVNHLLFDHMTQGSERKLDAHIWNIAADCMINQHIRVLPEGCITPEAIEKLVNKKVKRLEHSEYYYNILMKEKKKLEKMFPHDDHSLEGVPGKAKGKESQIAVRKAVNNALKAAAGNIPEHLKGMISDILKPEKIPWQQILRNFIGQAISSTSEGTRKKAHRRFDLDAPGKRKRRELTLGICADSSGSVSNELFADFLNEVVHIMKSVGTSYFIDADCEIQSIEVLKKGKKFTFKRSGNGGTAYQPAITKCKELKCDAIIYMGDGDSADTPLNPGKPFLWVLPEGCNPPANFGKVLTI